MAPRTHRFAQLVLATVLSAALAVTLSGTAGAVALCRGHHDGDGIKQHHNPRVIPPQAKAYGKSYGEWGAAWWEWAVSIPYATNPIFDPTGADGSQGQNQIPWFLAGTAGGAVDRTITIPCGRPVFFPLVAFANDYPCPDPTFQPAPGQSLQDFLTQGADAIVSQIDVLTAEVDGVTINSLTAYRGTSGLDYFTGDPSLTATFDPCLTGSSQAFVSDGYWLMLAPFPPGHHTIHFTGGISAWGFLVDVTYHITVPAGHGPAPALANGPQSLLPVNPVNGSWGSLKIRYR